MTYWKPLPKETKQESQERMDALMEAMDEKYFEANNNAVVFLADYRNADRNQSIGQI